MSNASIPVAGTTANLQTYRRDINGTLVDAEVVAMGQLADAGNSAFWKSSTQFVGVWTTTREEGYVRQLTVLAALDSTGAANNSTLGGTFIFEYSEDGTNATISETRVITDFSTVRDFDLLNAGAYYRVKFTPGRALVGSEAVIISTTQRSQNDGSFVRLANQQIEEANAAMPQTFVYLKAFDPVTGKSVNLRNSPNEALRVSDDKLFVTPSGSVYNEGFRDVITHIFSTSQGAADIARLANSSSGSGAVTQDNTNGQALFSTGATANSHALFFSEKHFTYESGHGLLMSQSFRLSALPTGNAYGEWGVSDKARANGSGQGRDATGSYVWRMKNSVYEYKQYQPNWNRDKADGQVPSLFKHAGVRQALDPTKINVYYKEFEWYGADTHNAYIKPPQGGPPLPTDVEEFPNNFNGSTLPDPNLYGFIDVFNGTSGQNLTVASGSWHGGGYTNKFAIAGINPNGDYVDAKQGGSVTNNPTPVALNASQTYTSAVYPCTGYVSLSCAITANQISAANGIRFDFYDDPAGAVSKSTEFFTFSANDAAQGSKFLALPVENDYFKITYTNGGTNQGFFYINLRLNTAAIETPRDSIESAVDSGTSAVQGRNVIVAKNISGVYSNVTNTQPDASNRVGLHVGIMKHDVATPILALTSWNTNQATIASTTTAVNVVSSPASGRKTVAIKSLSSNTKTVFIGSSSGVTSGSGWELAAGESIAIEVDPTASVWAIGSTATAQTLCYAEVAGTP